MHSQGHARVENMRSFCAKSRLIASGLSFGRPADPPLEVLRKFTIVGTLERIKVLLRQVCAELRIELCQTRTFPHLMVTPNGSDCTDDTVHPMETLLYNEANRRVDQEVYKHIQN